MAGDIPSELYEDYGKRMKTDSNEYYKPAKYTDTIKSFALTLHGYSPKAYRFIRETFMNILPHETTLSRWLTKLDVSPGFSAAALSHLSIIAKTEAVKGKNIFASLSLDEMKIKQSMSFD